MKVRVEDDGTLVVSMSQGERVRATLEQLAARYRIRGGRVSAIGTLEDPEVGRYDLDNHQYVAKILKGHYTLLSLDGNLSLVEGRPFLHVHVALGCDDWLVRGGHLFDARVGALFEAFIMPTETPIRRLPCVEVGLALWEPGIESEEEVEED